MDKIVVNALFYRPETWEKIKNHILIEDELDDIKYFYHQAILIDLKNIESAVPQDEPWLEAGKYTELRMKSGDKFVIKISTIDLARMIDHISAEKYLCKLKN